MMLANIEITRFRSVSLQHVLKQLGDPTIFVTEIWQSKNRSLYRVHCPGLKRKTIFGWQSVPKYVFVYGPWSALTAWQRRLSRHELRHTSSSHEHPIYDGRWTDVVG